MATCKTVPFLNRFSPNRLALTKKVTILHFALCYNLYSFIIIQSNVKSPFDGVECGECGLFICSLLFLASFCPIVFSIDLALDLAAFARYILTLRNVTHTKTTRLLLRLGDMSQTETEK